MYFTLYLIYFKHYRYFTKINRYRYRTLYKRTKISKIEDKTTLTYCILRTIRSYTSWRLRCFFMLLATANPLPQR